MSMELQVKRILNKSDLKSEDLEIYHKSCNGGKVEIIEDDIVGNHFKCLRCKCMSSIPFNNFGLALLFKIALNGGENKITDSTIACID